MTTSVYELDGSRVYTIEDFFNEVERGLIKDRHWGRSLEAFNDVLRGGYGTPDDGFVLRILDAATMEACVGRKLFRKLLEIVRRHGPGGLEAKHGVVLELA